jgi:5-(carboxyamino)imidazole ribonucleotide synthase
MSYKIGILGGGQLAKMSALAAYRLGFEINILEKEKSSPAGKITPNEFVGWVDDKNILKKFIKKCDVITLENEFIDGDHLEWIENQGKKVIPSSKTIKLIQDKLIQKQTFKNAKLPIPNFVEIKSNSTYENLKKILGDKFLLKSRKFGYDGYGNAFISNEFDFTLALEKLSERHTNLMAEEFIDFQKELAVMVVRTKNEIRTYPVVETIQKNHICHIVIAPAQIEQSLIEQIKKIAIEAVKSIKGYVIFGIEFFLTKDNKILINEIAPRPHNSGHYTIDACVTSQFENHIRGVLNLPLGSTDMIYPYAVMINLLGKVNRSTEKLNLSRILKFDDAHLHIYGKKESRIGRKMGHITFCGNDLNLIYKKALEAEQEIII